ncbi:MAG: hypothetical protein CVU24_18600 [Betaproteobacteria bacterium HGW-Betaproteobacteria-18]|nr:MAG: hypothetical protein CVU24_18600 [Betaproteobacteria bacterium HGW-Betaproteobacteria-18]
MITMDMIGKVRRMKMRDRLTIRGIPRKTGLSRNTVKATGCALAMTNVWLLHAQGLRRRDGGTPSWRARRVRPSTASCEPRSGSSFRRSS